MPLEEPIARRLKKHAQLLVERRESYTKAINGINDTIKTGKFNEHSLQALEIAKMKHQSVIKHGKNFFDELNEFNLSHKTFMEAKAVNFTEAGITDPDEEQFNKVLSLKHTYLKNELQEATEELPLIQEILKKHPTKKQA